MWPSIAPDSTKSSVAVTAADCAGLQFGRSAQAFGGGARQSTVPLSAARANSPPPAVGSGSTGRPAAGLGRLTSETATNTVFPFVAVPHWTPPSRPPAPTRRLQTTRPLSSGSSAQTIPDFWPTVSARLPPSSPIRLADEPRSWSDPCGSGQFALSAEPQASFQTSPASSCCDHTIFPSSSRSARTASLVSVAGAEWLSPVPT